MESCSPHICSRETTKKSPTDGKTMKLEKTCRRYQNARKCLDTRTDSKVKVMLGILTGKARAKCFRG